MLKKIKIYNLNEYIERHLIEGKKYIVFDFSTGIGIIEGSNGVITIDSEGVGYNLSNIEEEFKIGINNQPKKL